MTNTDRLDIYDRVTNAIIVDLEKGIRPWHRPWNAEHAAGRINGPLRANGQPYKGINVLMLWEAATRQGFVAPIWMTFKQAKELGGNVKKSEKGSLVVYANNMTKTEASDDGEEARRDIYFMKGYTVFNVEQVEGLPGQFYGTAKEPVDQVERIEQADLFVSSTGADIRHGGNQAFYAPARDCIQLPPLVAFEDAESYYATLTHELTPLDEAPGTA